MALRILRNRLASQKAALFSSVSVERATYGRSRVPPPKNEPFLHYAPGSIERQKLRAAIDKMKNECPEIPCIVNGEPVFTGKVKKQVMPTKHSHAVCTYHELDEKTSKMAIESSLEAKKLWERLPFDDRAAIFLKAADLLATKYRAQLCAAVMLGTGKNVWQAEIDAAVETCDFWRFGTSFAEQIYNMQPTEQPPYTWNRMEYRPLEGFLVAISPFNFVAIGANLPSTPALMGNTVVWKPSDTALLGNYIIYQILQEAGLPPGVINFLPGDGKQLGSVAFKHPEFAGLHFTGSTRTFNSIWKEIAQNLDNYKAYPRIVGETGGKNFHFVHSSADVSNVVNNTIRSAFEYSGQKCSACSRMYVPDNLWPAIKAGLLAEHAKIKVGQPEDFSVFMTSVIDGVSFKKIKSYIDAARASPSCEIIAGGKCDDSEGYFIEPTIIVTKDPHYATMKDELFGPVLTIYVYPHQQYDETLAIASKTASYALTGALFSQDRYALEKGSNALIHAAGNFYLNDKSTGSMVGQQPFGGARGSGTNDKSGSLLNYLRWVSARSIKESFLPCTNWTYPHMQPGN
eukprot:TRINITY_DN4210_c0_g1_i6.p1 TRINITY_DN4210_c0_g1~~TRINITY_DN4210_c0_g1_i6.p1  ORF type:complete len:571 (+),score=206.84 TRINITY_DN4210_c0_g1_i6:73-1785(+)